jgi:hypothetical protein
MMEPEEEMEIITDFIMRNRLMETFDEVHHLERLLKEAKERLKNEMDRRGVNTWRRWLWGWFGYY